MHQVVVIGISESSQNNEFSTLQEYANVLIGMHTLNTHFTDDKNPVLNPDDAFDAYDVLIVDDVQFLSNKDKMNEIFFNIFNYYIKVIKK